MSTVPILDADGVTRNIDVIPRTEGDEVIETQTVAITDPATGAPIDFATQATLAALLTAANAIKTAAESLDAKATVINTGAVAGIVALDAPTLAALETTTVGGVVSVSNMVEQGLTDTQLRATAVPVAAASLPLPAGASTETTLAAVQTLLAALVGTIYNHNSPFVDGSPGQLMLGKRRDADTTLVADGDLNTFNMDEAGRLKVSTQPASYSDASGNITANAQTVFANVDRASNVTISMVATSLVGHNATFEYSNNSTNGTDGNWYGVQVARSNANTAETATGVLAATPAYGWEVSVNAYKWIRVRATAHTSGTAAYIIKLGTYATEPVPIIQVTGTQPVSFAQPALVAGTARVGFIAGAGIWYDDSAVALAAAATFTGTSRDLTVTATATAFANAATYAMEARISAESDQAGTLWLETSRDNTNWRRVKAVPTAAVTGGGQFAEIVHRPSWRYMRVGFTNGATLQTRFTINSLMIAA